MADQRYEYQVEPLFLSPDELRNDRFELEDTIRAYAEDGWVLDQTVRVDASTFLFVFRRPVEG